MVPETERGFYKVSLSNHLVVRQLRWGESILEAYKDAVITGVVLTE